MMKRHPMNKKILQRYNMQYPFNSASVRQFKSDAFDGYLFDIIANECELLALRYVENYNDLIVSFDYELTDVDLYAIALKALQESTKGNYGIFNMHRSSIVTCNNRPYALVVCVGNVVAFEFDFITFHDTDSETGIHIAIDSARVTW